MAGESYTLPVRDEARISKRRTALILGSGAALSTVLLVGCGNNGSKHEANEPSPTTTSGSVPAAHIKAPRDNGRAVIVPNSHHVEVVQRAVPYFSDWYNVGPMEGRIPVNTTLVVDCVERGSGMATAPDMYHITENGKGGNPGVDKYVTMFAAANDFWNQPHPNPPDLNHAVDSAVPNCH